jgi:outer membrane biosynthesis protein TonB
VDWEPSGGLLVAEIVTGGASASDEYVEISNAANAPLDLGGHELVYVTATGATVTRKASWPGPLLVEPGRHVLVANTLGVHAAAADATYSGGLAATGGVIVLRRIGGPVVDAVGWGQAANSFVEGSPAPAPAAGQSIERRPGGSGGNVVDTNDNAADWIIVAVPLPQPLAAPPVPAPGSTPTPGPEPTATAEPTPTPEPAPTPTPTSTPSPGPSPAPTPSPEPTPTATPEPAPSPVPTPTPSPGPTPTPEPSPSPAPAIPVAAARLAVDGTRVVVEGLLTTPLGALEDGRGGFLQDESGGIALLLPASQPHVLAAGLLVRASGVVDDRYAQRTIRLDGPPVELGTSSLPAPQEIATGAASEVLEGWLVVAEGLVTEAPTALTRGYSLLLDDGSGALRVVLAFDAPSPPARGARLRVAGPLGQRDTSGTGGSGYRVFVTDPSLAQVLPAPTPEASPSPTDSPSPTPTPAASPPPSLAPSPTSSPTPSPTPAATPTPAPPVTIATARALGAGGRAFVEGVVAAEAGLLGLPALVAIQDTTGGLFVRLPDGAPRPVRGTQVRLSGKLVDPHGQLEIRPVARDFAVVADGSLPDPVPIGAAQMGEATEGRLVTLEGTLDTAMVDGVSGDAVLRLVDATGTAFRARAARASGITTSTLVPGTRLRLTGLVGQRASRKGALDGYRLWLRDPSDLAVIATAPAPGPSATPRPSPGVPATGPTEPIAAILLRASGPVSIEGVVTTPALLLDSTGRRIIVEDSSAAVEVLLPAGNAAPAQGSRVRVAGDLGTAYGAPRVRASAVESLGAGVLPRPRPLATEPGPPDEGELVRIEGQIVDVLRFGDRWRAEVRTAHAVLVVAGLPGAGIPAGVLVEGRRATVIGVVRRPHPAASDRRFAVVPRQSGDVQVQGPDRRAAAAGPAGTSRRTTSQPAQAISPPPTERTPSVDLADLGTRIGDLVRVGGLVAAIGETSIFVDDGTARAEVRLLGDAAPLVPLVEPGDAVSAVGRVAADPSGPRVEVTEPAGFVHLGLLGEAIPIVGAGDAPTNGGPPGEVVAPGHMPALATDSSAQPAYVDVIGDAGTPPGAAAAALLGLVALAGLVTTRRLRERRRLAVRIARRLAALSEDRPASRARASGARQPAGRARSAGEPTSPRVPAREPA